MSSIHATTWRSRMARASRRPRRIRARPTHALASSRGARTATATSPTWAEAALTDDDAFQQTVERALSSLPQRLQAAMENVAIMVEDEDDEEPDLYGLYRGTPLPERTGERYAGSLPDTISVYRRPLTEDF